MPDKCKTATLTDLIRRLSVISNIVGKQGHNYRVILIWHAGLSFLAGLSSSFIGMYPYDLGADVIDIGYLRTVNALSACIPALVGGALAQKYGRKRLMIRIWPSYVAFYVLLTVAPTWSFLVPAYLAYSVAYAGDPAFADLYADSLDKDTIAEALSIDSTLTGVLAFTTPAVGGLLLEYLGGITNPHALRVFYVGYVLYHVFTIAYFWKFLKDDVHYEYKNTVTDSVRSIGAVFKEDRIRRYLVFTAAAFLAAGLSSSFVTIYIFSGLGASPTLVGAMATVNSFITYLALNFGAWWSDRFGRKTMMATGYLFSAAALVALALAQSPALLLPYFVFVSLGAIGTAAESALISEYAPPDLRSRYFGAREALSLAAAAIAPPLGGIIYASLGPQVLFLIQAGLQLFVVLPYFLLTIPETKQATRAPLHILRRPRLPTWLTPHANTSH